LEHLTSVLPPKDSDIAAFGLGGVFDGITLGPVANHDQRHFETRHRGHVCEVVRTFVLRQLSNEQRVWLWQRACCCIGLSTNALHVNTIGDSFDPRSCEFWNARAQRISNMSADGDNGVSIRDCRLFAP
jgi:hypothetical protein